MKIKLTSVMVADQDKAQQFYTNVLGFVTKTEIAMGKHKWLTVVSPDEEDGVELVLEPNAFGPAQEYQHQLYEAGIPATSFNVDDLASEVDRLEKAGVVFIVKPTEVGAASVAVFDDTCGNNIQLYQV